MNTKPLPLDEAASERARRVKLVALDVDGVLTDGGLLYTGDGETLKRFDVRDGLGIKLLAHAGIQVAVITARQSPALERRLKDLGVTHFFPNCSTKRQTLAELCERLGLSLAEAAFCGDDLVDLPALEAVGFPIAVQNAHERLKRMAAWTTSRGGGDGAVRELAEAIIAAQQPFDAFVDDYLAHRTQKPKLAFSVVIPARYASSRLPGKPLLPLGGKPMIQHVLENAQKAGARDVIVATDDERIRDAVAALGSECMMTSAEHTSGTDRLAEVAREKGWDPQHIVINLQGDEPLVGPELLQLVAQELADNPNAGISTLATPISSVSDVFDPNVVKVVVAESGLACYFSRAPIPYQRDVFRDADPQQLESLPEGTPFLRHLGLYGYRVGTLLELSSAPSAAIERAESLEQLRALHLGIGVAVRTIAQAPGHGIDTEADLARVRRELGADADA